MYRRAGALALVAVTVACGSRSRLLDPGVSAGATGGAGAVGGAGGSSAGGAGGSSAGGTSSGGNGGSAGCYAEVVAGGYHTCARTPLGHVYCFGANQFGQLGSGVPQDSATVPEPIVGPGDFVALGGGESHSSGVRAAGFMMSWGHNSLGVLGDGTTTDRPFAVAMKGPGDAVALSQGMVAYQACAVHGNGSVTC